MNWRIFLSIMQKAKVDDEGERRADETEKVGNERPRSQKRGCDVTEAGNVSLRGIGLTTFIR